MLSIYSVVVLAAAAWSLPSSPRDVTTVLTNLEAIDAATNTLKSTITSWDASLTGALGIQSDVTSLETTITDATTEAKTESQASSADSTTVLTYVTGTLGPDITAALNALTAREADFAALSLNSLVVTDLQTLQSDTDALGTALVAISSTDVKTSAQAAIAQVDAAFVSAIAAFS